MSVIKKIFQTLSFLLVLSDLCFGQDTKEGGFKLTFDEYKIDSCLYNILEAIVETDSAQIRFPSDIYFYNFSYGNYTNYRDMIIRPTRWYKHLPLDTKGIVVVEGAKFVLMGRLENDSLFKKTDNQIEISVNYPVPQVFDTLDNRTKWLGWEKSPTALVGSVKFCGDPPIDLRVDFDKKIERLSLAGK
jgi:hypothetical protein